VGKKGAKVNECQRSGGREFDSQPLRWESHSPTPTSVTQQYNVVLATGWRGTASGKVTAGLAKTNGNLPWGLRLTSSAG